MWGTRIKDLPFKLVVQSEIEIWRAADFWVKEPETIAWIDSFEPNGVFWDIGANIGVFSLYADKVCKEIYAFEPDEINFDRLLANFQLQKWEGRHAWWAAISDSDGNCKFLSNNSGPGKSGGQIEAKDGYEVQTHKIDSLSTRIGVPNHIKIDVDGIEWRILQGGKETLAKPEVKSVLVEVNNNQEEIEKFMVERGFTSFNRFNGADINRRAGQKQRNVIYVRKNLDGN